MSRSPLRSAQWRQIGALTLGAAVLLLALRALPAGPKLTHLDFVAGGPGALEFCDPGNPKFLPVVERASPVAMTLAPGVHGEVLLTLRTVTGKPIGPDDLISVAGKQLRVFVIDPALEDFQVVNPGPAGRPGAWRFTFQPRARGSYRVFADFTPAATALEMYASADLPAVTPEVERVAPNALATVPAQANALGATRSTGVAESGGLSFTLVASAQPIRAREPVELALIVERRDGGDLSLEPVDGAWATLVAIDWRRSGFVSLHAGSPSAQGRAVRLVASVTIPDPGHYVIWSRVRTEGREITAPFALDVLP